MSGNMAQQLAQRMQSPGAMAELFDRTSNPQALSQVGPPASGSDVQEPGGVDDAAIAQSNAGPSIQGDAGGGMPGDAGLGMLSSAMASAHGDKKAALEKAHAHGAAKQKGFKHKGAPGNREKSGHGYEKNVHGRGLFKKTI